MINHTNKDQLEVVHRIRSILILLGQIVHKFVFIHHNRSILVHMEKVLEPLGMFGLVSQRHRDQLVVLGSIKSIQLLLVRIQQILILVD